MRSENSSQTEAAQDHLAYVRLRSPQQNGEALDVPSASSVDDLFEANLLLRSSYSEALSEFSLIARRQVFDAAVDYARRYLPEVDSWLDSVSPDRVVMTGHQPTLFHPGVWYKNFRLDALAKRFDALPINLVVDNDLLASPSISCPQLKRDGEDREHPTAAVVMLPMDQPDATVPHEKRPVLNAERFANFGSEVKAAIGSVVEQPIVDTLWPEVIAAKQILGNQSLGQVLAAGRHRLEWSLGLRTLEVPISVVASTMAFGSFAGRVLMEIENFQAIYNGVLLRYRKRHSIRSVSHPVPELARVRSWMETPFWVWTEQDRQRRPLFVQVDSQRFLLSDLKNFEQSVGIGELPGWWSEEVKSNRVCIRPRALCTTMFHRLLVSDLFIHGIGGAKYDQLTDQIIREFFDVDPPGYLTSTATFSLPFSAAKVSRQDVLAKQQLLREFRFHPENHVAHSPETSDLIRQKQAAIEQLSQGDSKKQAHEKIVAANQQMSSRLAKQISATEREIAVLKSQHRSSEILHSREYSFALHPTSIIEDLKSLAQQ